VAAIAARSDSRIKPINSDTVCGFASAASSELCHKRFRLAGTDSAPRWPPSPIRRSFTRSSTVSAAAARAGGIDPAAAAQRIGQTQWFIARCETGSRRWTLPSSCSGAGMRADPVKPQAAAHAAVEPPPVPRCRPKPEPMPQPAFFLSPYLPCGLKRPLRIALSIYAATTTREAATWSATELAEPCTM